MRSILKRSGQEGTKKRVSIGREAVDDHAHGEPLYSDGTPTNEPPGDPSSEPRDCMYTDRARAEVAELQVEVAELQAKVAQRDARVAQLEAWVTHAKPGLAGVYVDRMVKEYRQLLM